MKLRLATAASIIALTFASSAMAQSNTSNVTQYGETNGATIEQIGAGANNTSTVNQGVDNNDSALNTAEVDQDGTNVLKNDSIINQDGEGNSAVVSQGGSGVGIDYNDSFIDQNGNGNSANVTQGDLVLSNESTITQSGSQNTATVSQGGDEGVNLGPNLSTVEQIGFSNDAIVTQGGLGAVNTSDVYQNGDGIGGDNFASVDQGGSSINWSDIDQYGNLDSAMVIQNAGAGVINNSTVYQNGVGNMTTVNQN